MQFTAQQERYTRTALRTLILPVGDFVIFTDRPLIRSKEDFVERFYSEEAGHAGGRVVRYALIEFGQFTDTEDGCADNPIVLIGYNIHAFVEFYGTAGSEADNSQNELTAFILDLRNLILNTPWLSIADGTQHALTPLEQPEFIITETDTLTGVGGSYADLTLQVEIAQ